MDLRPVDFGPVVKAAFLERPNRFLVRARPRAARGIGAVEAFLPNPGRLWELLIPGATLYLAGDPAAGASPRRTRHTVLAVERDGAPVFLHTHATNSVARFLLERRLIPSLEAAEVVRAEVRVGRSRFDFLLRENGRDLYAEVKSCTLFGNGVAMFPDAVTERGRRHLLELAGLHAPGIGALLLFLIHTPRVRWFMPDYHTDLAFSTAFLSARETLRIVPVALGWREDLSLAPRPRLVHIPWDFLEGEVKDRGSYVLILRLRRHASFEVGGLGRLAFPAGHYLYVGSAMRLLTARLARHLRRRKLLRWHIDYLREHAEEVLALPIRSSDRLECRIARALASAFRAGPARFGSSDCACPTHLFYSPLPPLHLRAFHAVLQRFRMRAQADQPSALAPQPGQER